MSGFPFVIVCVLAVTAVGCGGSSDDDDDDYDDYREDLIIDASASCDPGASAWDDLFSFEAETLSGVDSVEVDAYVGSSFAGTVRLGERGGGNWYGEEWADDLDADCDDWSAMYFEVWAEDGSDAEYVVINP